MLKRHHLTTFTCGIANTLKQATVLVGLSGLLISGMVNATTPFTTPGDVTINPIGGVNYNIPIDVPVGTAGMEPKISISYTGGAGNGMMGLGFGITGLPQISRCSKAKHLDGVSSVIDFSKNDRFCLDGQRLFATSDQAQADGTHKTTSAYGKNLTEYRTEQANFSKIISYGQTANADGTTAPHYFKVWTKSGQIFRFGYTADSRANIQTGGDIPARLKSKDLVRVWAVDQISDTVGNYINVEYTDDGSFSNAGLEGGNSEVYISRINYTGNTRASTLPYASVRFEYEGRADTKDKDYLAGTEVKKTKRLKTIKTYYQENLVKQYKLTYRNDGAYSHEDDYDKNGTLLSKVEECDASNICLEPTEFGWEIGEEYHLSSDGDLTLFHNGQTDKLPSTAALDTAFDVIAVGDVNGDGLQDILYLDHLYDDNAGNQSAWYYLGINTGSGFVKQGEALEWVGRSCAKYGVRLYTQECLYYSYWDVMPHLADVNDDGMADLVYGETLSVPSKVLVRLSTGNGFGTEQTWMAGKEVVAVGDYDGDYRADIVFEDSVTQTATQTTRTLGLAKSDGTKFVNQHVNLGTQHYVCIKPNYLPIGGIDQHNPCNAANYRGPSERVFLADVNGDGRADLIKDGLIKRSVVSDSGAVSFGADENWFKNYVTGGNSVINIADHNNDGKADVVYHRMNSNGSAYFLGISTNENFEDANDIYVNANNGMGASCSLRAMGACVGGWQPYNKGAFVYDFNNDGQGDFFRNKYYAEGISLRPDRLQTITQGFANKITLYYGKLSGSLGVYQTYETDQGVSGVDATYPNMDILQNSSQEVVTAIARSSGLEGTNTDHVTTYYQYGGGKTNVKGHGFLGFRWQKETHANHKKNTTTYFIQHAPYIGIPFQTEMRLENGTLVGRTDKTYTQTLLPISTSKTKYPHLQKLTEYGFKQNGELLTRTVTSNTYDDFGNVTKVTVQTGDVNAGGSVSNPAGISISNVHTKTTTNTFYNNPGQYNTVGSNKWILGRLIRSTVTSTNSTVLPTVAAMPGQDHSPATPAVDILNEAEQPNEAPTVTVSASDTSPAVDDDIILTAIATDADGSIKQVDFMVNGLVVGTDTAPDTGTNTYRVAWKVTSGNSVLTAKATDNDDAVTTSSGLGLTVTAANTANAKPTVTAAVSNSNPSVDDVVTLTATAADSDGTVAKVEFLVDNVVVNTDIAAPYSYDWTATAGTHTIVTRATDNDNAVTNSSNVSVTVAASGNNDNNGTVELLSQGKPTEQSSEWSGLPMSVASELAVDGDHTTQLQWNNTNSVTHTANEANAWWQVDLGQEASIDRVKVWNRSDHSDPLSNVYIFVSETDMRGRSYADIKADSSIKQHYHAGQMGVAPDYTQEVSMDGFAGRYVRIQLAGTNQLTLAEVEVYGSTGGSSSGGSTTPSNTPPTVSVTASNTSPTDGDTVTLTATAADSDGSISKVEFLVDNVVVNTDTTAPYSYNWTAAEGTHTVIARATDNDSAVTNSSSVSVTVAASAGNDNNDNNSGTVELLSQGKPATQSTTLTGYGVTPSADKAVDGNTSGLWTGNDATQSMTHTASDTENEPWWQVDLGQSSSIERVKVWNRTDCCSDRLQYFYIFVSDNDMTGKTVQELLSDSTVTAEHVNENLWNVESKEVVLTNAQGRYIKIQRAGVGILTLAEVEVFGIAGGSSGSGNTGSGSGGDTTPPANQPPTVALESPADGSSSVEGNPITLTAVAGDNDGTVTSVAFYSGAQQLGSDTTAPYSVTWNNVAVGSHSITAVATDDTGATVTSAAHTINVTADTSNNSGGSTLYSEDFSGATHSLTVWGGVQVTGLGTSTGKVLLENFNQANQNWPGYRSAQTFDYVVGQIFRAEVTTGGLSGLDGKVFIEGQKPDGTSVQLRANFGSGGFSSHYVDNGWHWGVGNAVKANTTYIVEIEMTANGPTLYVHEQGAARGSSMIREANGGAWTNFQLRGEGYQGPSVGGTTQLSVDNLTISQP